MLLEVDKYPNLLNDIPMSCDEIEEQVSDIGLFFEQHIDDEVEDKLSLPPFINSFYEFVLNEKRIPKQYEWVLFYMDKLSVREVINTESRKVGLRSRMFRVYPSLVRDIHF